MERGRYGKLSSKSERNSEKTGGIGEIKNIRKWQEEEITDRER